MTSDAVSYRYMFGTLSGKSIRPKMFEKRFVVLPTKEERKFRFDEAFEFCKRVGIPVSTLASLFSGVKFVREIPEGARVSFVWLDTVNGIPTTLHVYDDDNGFQSFGDFEEGWNALGDVVVGFDLFRYQFRHLAQDEALSYLFNEYHLGGSTFYGPRYKLALDLTWFVRVVTGKRWQRFVSEHRIYTSDRVSLARQVYELLDVPTLFRILAHFLPMDRNLMQLTYLDNLKGYMLHAAYLRNHYIVAAPVVESGQPNNYSPVRVDVPGFYQDYVEYDVSSAYPTTALIESVDPFGVGVFPSLLKDLMSYKETLPHGFARDLVKKFSVALVGYLNYDNSRFKNVFYAPVAWSRITGTFNSRFQQLVDDIKPVWARVDSVVVPASSSLPFLGYAYRFGVKHHYAWLAIYSNDHLLGKDLGSDELVKKGFDFATPWGNAPYFPVVFDRARQTLESMISMDPQRVLYHDGVYQTLQAVLDASLSSRPYEYEISFLKSAKEVPNTPAKSSVFPYLQEGYNRGVVCHGAFCPVDSVNMQDVDLHFYVSGIVNSLVQYFPPDRWDPVDVINFIDSYVGEDNGDD